MYNIVTLQNGLENIEGFFCGATNVGMRTNPANSGPSDIDGDVAFIRSDRPCDIAARFTNNTFQAAPIVHYKKYPENFQTDFVLINAKNANAMTGDKGVEDIDNIMSILSLKHPVLNPVMSSTGVIGYRLPVDKISSAFDTLDFESKNSHLSARAIMTTDSFKKRVGIQSRT